MSYPQFIHKLPIVNYLDEICSKLKQSKSRFLVLTAETAAGKSTALPVALLKHFEGKILMTEPRRLSAVAVATRVSEILGENVGETVGYTLHLESKKSDATRLEVLTEAILTRKLQNDALLEDVNVVVLDEFHERSVHLDLALAFLKQAMELRDDLYVVIMSATIDATPIAEFLNAETISIKGRLFPVETEYCAENVDNSVISLLTNKQSLVNTSENLKNVDKLCTTTNNFENSSKEFSEIHRCDSILVFLPGIYEINKAKSSIEEKLRALGMENDVEILVLHSSVPLSSQKKILVGAKKNEPRRVILSSAIAETSLTVPGVSIVVDSGLSRISRMDVSLGMEKLVTERESEFSAEQRKGRAGRMMSGRCIRLWKKSDVLQKSTPTEILRTDLAQLVLECAKWGADEIKKLEWLTPPSKSAWNAAKNLLLMLGLIDENSKLTKKGDAALKMGLPPRLSCVALCGEKAIPTVIKFSEYGDASEERKRAFADDLRKRLSKAKFSESAEKNSTKVSEKEILLAGFPDRIAKRIEAKESGTVYQFPSGRKAVLKLTNGSEWIVAAKVDAGETTGKIYEYEILDSDFAEEWLSSRASVSKSTVLDENMKVQKSEKLHYGKIILKEKKLRATSEDFSDAVCQTLKEKGFKWLKTGNKTEEFLSRAIFYATKKGDDELSEKIDTLSENAEIWLKPFLTGGKIDESIVIDALRYHLSAEKIDKDVPSEIKLPNGRKRKISYEKIQSKDEEGKIQIRPVMEIIIQQIFGCFETPKILGTPVLLKLLSPARRPLQITDDLANFWNGAWIEICKEMKGRYPKHNWDYRIAEKDE